MGSLRLAAAVIALARAVSARADPIDRWAVPIREASQRFAIPETWIRRVMRAESGGQTMWRGRLIQSRAGAMGLMQLMPATWREVRALHGLGFDPYDPRDNILAGTAYLRAMYERFGYPGMFAAYNAGPQRFSEHLVSGRQLPAETNAYAKKFASVPDPVPTIQKSLQRQPAQHGLFVVAGRDSRELRQTRLTASATIFFELDRSK